MCRIGKCEICSYIVHVYITFVSSTDTNICITNFITIFSGEYIFVRLKQLNNFEDCTSISEYHYDFFRIPWVSCVLQNTA